MSERLNDQELNAAIHKAVREFKGYVPTLKSAIGALFLGRVVGWNVLLLIHNRSTIIKYQDILKIDFKAQMEPTTEFSKKSYVWVFAEKTKAFWKLVRGQIPHAKRTWLAKDEVSEAVAQRTQRGGP